MRLRQVSTRYGSGLARIAVGLLVMIVIGQSIFLLSVLHILHTEEAPQPPLAPSTAGGGAAPARDPAVPSTPRRSTASNQRPVVSAWQGDVTWASLEKRFTQFQFPALSSTSSSSSTTSTDKTTAIGRRPAQPQQPKVPSKEDGLHAGNAQTEVQVNRHVPETVPPTRAPLVAGLNKPHRGSSPTPPRPQRTSSTAPQPPSRRSTGTRFVETMVDVHLHESLLQDVPLPLTSAPKALDHLERAAVLILCYNRPAMLQQAVGSIVGARLSQHIAKYISQDGDDPETAAVVAAAVSDHHFIGLRHERTLPATLHGQLDEEGNEKQTPGTMYLAHHYKGALDVLFLEKKHSHVIIVEDDMKVSKDFFEFFETLAPLLAADPTLWCISSWNDNGFRSFDLPAEGLFRSSYFPGLGWMLQRSLWLELSPQFPADNWDHWMRATTTSKHRECISPWRSRNYNVGSGGATSNEEFYAQFLEPIELHNGVYAPLGDLSKLTGRNYFTTMEAKLQSIHSTHIFAGPTLSQAQVATFRAGESYLVYYAHEEFEVLAQVFSIHPTPRSFYRRMQWLKINGADIFLVDRRLSPFIPPSLRLARRPDLAAVMAPSPGMHCIDVCSRGAHGGGPAMVCAEDQFDFINDCETINSTLLSLSGNHGGGGCRNGCTQGWGQDIPNIEVEGVGHAPMCLATEVVPTCDASFPFTRRLCPCVPPVTVQRAPSHVAAVPADRTGASCDEVCAHFSGDPHNPGANWRCDSTAFSAINRCDVLQQYFPCTKCGESFGPDLPSFVSSKTDGNFERCFWTPSVASCSGSHPHTQRLCPCVLRA